MQFYFSGGNKTPIYGFEMQDVFVCLKAITLYLSVLDIKCRFCQFKVNACLYCLFKKFFSFYYLTSKSTATVV